MDLKSQIGTTVGPIEFAVTQERMDLFARAVRAPVRSVAHPMFLTIFRQAEFELLQKLALPLSRILHGEQEYEFHDDLKSGDVAVFTTRLTNVMEKQGAHPMRILTFETVVTAGRPIARAKTVFIHREVPAQT